MATKPKNDTQLPTTEEFLKNVLRSGLVEREELRASVKAVPRDLRKDVQIVSDHLVRTGKLTRFQASKIIKGVSVGLVVGPYRVLTPLGRGGMGTVFLVRDQRSDQLLALKVLPPRLARTEERMLARFRSEMVMSREVAYRQLAW